MLKVVKGNKTINSIVQFKKGIIIKNIYKVALPFIKNNLMLDSLFESRDYTTLAFNPRTIQSQGYSLIFSIFRIDTKF